jgi:hypothetical protein
MAGTAARAQAHLSCRSADCSTCFGLILRLKERKGDQGFGEGNFRALFASIELYQIKRGVPEGQKER